MQENRSVTGKKARLARSSEALLSMREQEDMTQAELTGDLASYVDMLSGKVTSSKKRRRDAEEKPVEADSESESEDDGYFDKSGVSAGVGAVDDEDEDEGSGNRLVSRGSRHSSSKAADMFFSNPIFKEALLVGSTAPDSHIRLSAAATEALSSMPKTDKQKRADERRKQKERQERRASNCMGEPDLEEMSYTKFEVAPRSNESDFSGNGYTDEDEEEQGGGKKGKHSHAKDFPLQQLIKGGMGKALKVGSKDTGIEIVSKQTQELMNKIAERRGKGRSGSGEGETDTEGGVEGIEVEGNPNMSGEGGDDRGYGSDEEQYDAHDRATSLALGTLMLRRSKQKALVDASYNRFAWNDTKDLPSWFMDDEMKHNKPQLPIPEALLNQIKSRYLLYDIS